MKRTQNQGPIRHSRVTAVLLLLSLLTAYRGRAEDQTDGPPSLSEECLKGGAITLRAFAPISKTLRGSVVELQMDGSTVALGAVIDVGGLIVTKASEIKAGAVTCKLASGKEVKAVVIAADDENDLALLRVLATGLKPIRWETREPTLGQWAVTPGIGPTPEGAGVVSAAERRILHRRAYIGVELFDRKKARITRLMPGYGAERAGLKVDDLVLKVNDEAVDNRDDLTRALLRFREGQTVNLRVRRGEREFDVVVALTNPKADDIQPGERRQESMNRLGSDLSQRSEDFELAIQHDSVLEPWQCGGPLVNLDGKAIGLNIARSGRVASYALPAPLVRKAIEKLKAEYQLTVKASAK